MQRKGYLIRFIDIGLIILFGFLMISDLTVISQISLPGKSEEAADPVQSEAILLGVNIDANGAYSLSQLSDDTLLYTDIVASEELEFVLNTLMKQFASGGQVISAYIEPAADAPMQSLVDVLDVCERLGLPKNINTEAVATALSE